MMQNMTMIHARLFDGQSPKGTGLVYLKGGRYSYLVFNFVCRIGLTFFPVNVSVSIYFPLFPSFFHNHQTVLIKTGRLLKTL